MSKPKLKTYAKLDIPSILVTELLTPSEVRMLKNRWRMVKLLEEGLSIRQIAKEVKVGTDTVVRIARMMEKTTLRKLLDEILKKDKFKTRTPWIFGKS
ncbi:MAG: helix-turn-helix domain-containing protein [Candidatus Daviesbacteria bacterium]|nr:MAG: helix-turn-helix domain-containing protein [Candidatus Daviesbacteria bacterium]